MAIFAKQFGVFYGTCDEIVHTKSIEWVHQTNRSGLRVSCMSTLKDDDEATDENGNKIEGPGGKAIPPHFLKQMQRAQKGGGDGS